MRRRRRDILTTTEAAALLYCGTLTIIRCCDGGKLPFWFVPGSNRHRRILLAEVEAFARREGIPLDRVEAWKNRTKAA